MIYRGFPVFELAVDIQQLARLALAVAEVAIVEYQASVAGGGEAGGKGRQAHLARPAKPMRHHHHRERSCTQWAVKVGNATRAVGEELDCRWCQKIGDRVHERHLLEWLECRHSRPLPLGRLDGIRRLA
ncbi:hypothetical protein ABIA60_001015 [Pseudomonas frederiksbergensis]